MKITFQIFRVSTTVQSSEKVNKAFTLTEKLKIRNVCENHS